MDNLVEFRKFLTKDNPYAINIVINVFDNEVEKVKDKGYEDYLRLCEDIRDKFKTIESRYKEAMVKELKEPSREQEIYEVIQRVEEELWKDIEGYEGLYKVSNYGRIKSFTMWNGHKFVKRERVLSPYKQIANKNYSRSVVKLFKNGVKKDFKVHRLVAKAFIDNPYNFKVVNHKDGNPLNNHVSNLEWSTQKNNVLHSIENELLIRRINTIDRQTMVTMLNNNYSYDEIAKILGIAKGTVFNYIRKFKIKKRYV